MANGRVVEWAEERLCRRAQVEEGKVLEGFEG
jgi:hypothetical protein